MLHADRLGLGGLRSNSVGLMPSTMTRRYKESVGKAFILIEIYEVDRLWLESLGLNLAEA